LPQPFGVASRDRQRADLENGFLGRAAEFRLARDRLGDVAFGVVLDWDEFHAFAARLRERGVTFVIEPYIRFAGLVGEQATMFFRDPAGNALEFKAFRDRSQLFAK